jgi:hypothetical protein
MRGAGPALLTFQDRWGGLSCSETIRKASRDTGQVAECKWILKSMGESLLVSPYPETKGFTARMMTKTVRSLSSKGTRELNSLSF